MQGEEERKISASEFDPEAKTGSEVHTRVGHLDMCRSIYYGQELTKLSQRLKQPNESEPSSQISIKDSGGKGVDTTKEVRNHDLIKPAWDHDATTDGFSHKIIFQPGLDAAHHSVGGLNHEPENVDDTATTQPSLQEEETVPIAVNPKFTPISKLCDALQKLSSEFGIEHFIGEEGSTFRRLETNFHNDLKIDEMEFKNFGKACAVASFLYGDKALLGYTIKGEVAEAAICYNNDTLDIEEGHSNYKSERIKMFKKLSEHDETEFLKISYQISQKNTDNFKKACESLTDKFLSEKLLSYLIARHSGILIVSENEETNKRIEQKLNHIRASTVHEIWNNSESLKENPVLEFKKMALEEPSLETDFNEVANALSCFVCRQEEMGKLKTHLNSSGIVCITGPPGIGKTELARKYIESYPKKIWISAEHSELISLQIEKYLREKHKIEMLGCEPRFLAPQFYKKLDPDTCLVFDNVHNYETVHEYLSIIQKDIHIILTSRYQDWKFKQIVLKGFADDELTMFLSLKNIKSDEKLRSRIIDLCHGIPLAINLLVSYAENNNLNLEEACERFENKQIDGEDYLVDLFTLAIAELKTKNIIFLDEILNLSSYLSPDYISEDQIRDYCEYFNNIVSPQKITYVFTLLTKNSIFTKTIDHFKFHHLFQQAMRRILEKRKKLHDECHKVYLWLFQRFKEGSFGKNDSLIFHALSLSTIGEKLLSSHEQANLLNQISRKLHYLEGNYRAASKYVDKLISIQEKPSGVQWYLSESYILKAKIDYCLGNYNSAIDYVYKALPILDEKPGRMPWEFADTLNTKGEAFYSLGRYENAYKLFYESLDILTRKFGSKDLILVNTYKNLGNGGGSLDDSKKGEGGESEFLHVESVQFDHKTIESQSKSLGQIFSPAEDSKYAEISATLDEKGDIIKEKVSKSICSKRPELFQILEKEFGPFLRDARENGFIKEFSPHPDTLLIAALSGKYGTNQGFVLCAYYHPSERHTATTIGILGLQISRGEAGQLAISFQTKARCGNKCFYNTDFVGHCYNRERDWNDRFFVRIENIPENKESLQILKFLQEHDCEYVVVTGEHSLLNERYYLCPACNKVCSAETENLVGKPCLDHSQKDLELYYNFESQNAALKKEICSLRDKNFEKDKEISALRAKLRLPEENFSFHET